MPLNAAMPQERGLVSVEPICLYLRKLHVAAENIHRLRFQPGRNGGFRDREHNQKQSDGANTRPGSLAFRLLHAI